MSNRAYCLTLNNYTTEEYDILKDADVDYIIIGKEVGESGTPHLQVYLYKKNKMAFSTLKKLCPKAHIEVAKGSPADNYKYCSKDGDFVEVGELPSQGTRKDLAKLKDEIKNGKSVDEICVENPEIVHQYGRTLDRLEAIQKRKQYRKEMTTCEWIYGMTGVGKSHYAYKDFTPETHYSYTEDKGWWDGYEQQDIVIINEFRGEISYKRLLELIDKYPTQVSRRNKAPMPFISKHIIITSSMHPKDVFHNLAQKDSLEQLLDRINIIHLEGINMRKKA